MYFLDIKDIRKKIIKGNITIKFAYFLIIFGTLCTKYCAVALGVDRVNKLRFERREIKLFEIIHYKIEVTSTSKKVTETSSKGPIKIYRVARPGSGKNLSEKNSSPPCY